MDLRWSGLAAGSFIPGAISLARCFHSVTLPLPACLCVHTLAPLKLHLVFKDEEKSLTGVELAD